ncbi:MAG TPA: hypothetical protein VMJ32_08685 [Pirellulales bacterium]|nr:hypothetical protein [Pirellulales bacterium]
MKKLVVVLFAVVVTGSTFLGIVGTARSRPQYFGEFKKLYVKADSTSPDDKAFADAVKSARCGVCHEGESKKNRNDYGKALASILKPADAPADFKGETDKSKIDDALKKVADEHVDPNDSKSPTYGDLIKAGKLPGGEKK